MLRKKTLLQSKGLTTGKSSNVQVVEHRIIQERNNDEDNDIKILREMIEDTKSLISLCDDEEEMKNELNVKLRRLIARKMSLMEAKVGGF